MQGTELLQINLILTPMGFVSYNLTFVHNSSLILTGLLSIIVDNLFIISLSVVYNHPSIVPHLKYSDPAGESGHPLLHLLLLVLAGGRLNR